MINKYDGFKAEKSSGFEPLPAGGYVAKIMGARVEHYSWGDVLVIAFDICEGDYTGIFQKRFETDTNSDRKWKGTYRITVPDESSQYFSSQRRAFNNLIFALEDSNGNFHFDWDETKLKNLIFGVLFREKEWEWQGKTGWTTECCACTTADDIREESFSVPKPKALTKKTAEITQSNQAVDNFTDEDLPF